ncbi:carbonic anhydrase [Hydra vulgaris]|uniref:carbonic anhydrase n=1 Tax=Hydra vulgaris TaxID=6087 RepID=UPI0006413638
MNHRIIFAIVGCQLAIAVLGNDESAHHGEWSYDSDTGPMYWYYDHPNCNGTRQSPINIIENQTIYNESLTSLLLFNYSTVFNNTNYYLTNNGHTIILGMDSNSSITVGLFWKGKQYNYYGLHFHWGENDTFGSEHLLSNKHFPLEVHIVHYLNDYGNFSNSLNYADGVLVWGILYQLDNSIDVNNNSLKDVFNNIQNVINAGNKTNIVPVPLSSFVPQNSSDSYYHYAGSLTTPECSESVMWIVNQKFMKVSSIQLQAFRLLKGHLHNVSDSVEPEVLTENDRPIQPLNGRKVYTSIPFLNSSDSSSSSLLPATASFTPTDSSSSSLLPASSSFTSTNSSSSSLLPASSFFTPTYSSSSSLLPATALYIIFSFISLVFL